jgi:hypothetical protein
MVWGQEWGVMGMKWRGNEGVFIGLERRVHSVLDAYVCVLFTSNLMAASYAQVLSSDQSKK